jgi:NADH-quinone oxidoreductase subunit M
VGEFMILIGSFDSPVIGGVFAILAAASVILAAVYLLNMFRKTMFGESTAAFKEKITDLSGREVSLLMPLVILMFVIGLYATPFLQQINRGSERVLSQVQEYSDIRHLIPVEMVLETPEIRE